MRSLRIAWLWAFTLTVSSSSVFAQARIPHQLPTAAGDVQRPTAFSPFAVPDPWIITTDVVVSEPTEVGDVIIVGNGSLTVLDLPEPGLQVDGNVWVMGDGHVRFENSVIQFLSMFHGQYVLAGIDHARIEVVGCDYRIPSGVQHGLVIGGEGELLVEDTDFGSVQLVSINTARLTARRLNGSFEVIVQNDSQIVLEDIPRDPGRGTLWVWVEFPVGSEAEYSPPMPGFIDSWTFPPEGAVGILQSATIRRCNVFLWPMLVREGCRLTLRDIDENNWVVVGFYLPSSAQLTGLQNGLYYQDTTLDFEDREIRLVNSSVDTWNLYPLNHASVVVRDSLLGEILSFGNSRVRMEHTTIDGTGGFFGARESSHISAFDCVFTCTIEVAQNATIELHRSAAEPYPDDSTGAFTRFGAYDRGRLLADTTTVGTTPALGGEGLIALTYLSDPPPAPPSGARTLRGSAAIFSLEEGPTLESWRLDAVPRLGGIPELIAEGGENVEEGELGVWSNADPNYDYLLRIILSDSLGRTLTGYNRVLGTAPPSRNAGPGGRQP
ncbi:MAG: hypothetical protein ACC742_04810 [Thermoanaerobaculales bacterium]